MRDIDIYDIFGISLTNCVNESHGFPYQAENEIIIPKISEAEFRLNFRGKAPGTTPTRGCGFSLFEVTMAMVFLSREIICVA